VFRTTINANQDVRKRAGVVHNRRDERLRAAGITVVHLESIRVLVNQRLDAQYHRIADMVRREFPQRTADDLGQIQGYDAYEIGKTVMWMGMPHFRTQQRLTEATAHFAALGADSWTAGWQSVSSLAGIVRRESFVMAFNDCFYLLGVALLLSAAVIPFFRHAKITGSGPVH
jgi:hypothetical protein